MQYDVSKPTSVRLCAIPGVRHGVIWAATSGLHVEAMHVLWTPASLARRLHPLRPSNEMMMYKSISPFDRYKCLRRLQLPPPVRPSPQPPSSLLQWGHGWCCLSWCSSCGLSSSFPGLPSHAGLSSTNSARLSLTATAPPNAWKARIADSLLLAIHLWMMTSLGCVPNACKGPKPCSEVFCETCCPDRCPSCAGICPVSCTLLASVELLTCTQPCRCKPTSFGHDIILFHCYHNHRTTAALQAAATGSSSCVSARRAANVRAAARHSSVLTAVRRSNGPSVVQELSATSAPHAPKRSGTYATSI